VVRAIEAFAEAPRPGEVYNLGGGRENSASLLECIALFEEITGRRVHWEYVDQNRVGDHICYISDVRKLRQHYPSWSITRSLRDICEELVAANSAAAR
jgi:CDP-paratose 2-epimerase